MRITPNGGGAGADTDQEQEDSRESVREIEREAVEQTPEPAPDEDEEDSRESVREIEREAVEQTPEPAPEEEEAEDPSIREAIGDGVRSVASGADQALGATLGRGAFEVDRAADAVDGAAGATPFGDDSDPSGPSSPTAQAVTGPEREPVGAIEDARQDFAEELGLETREVRADFDDGTVELGVAPGAQVDQLEEQILDDRPELDADDIDFEVEDGEVTAELPPEFDSRIPGAAGDRVESFRVSQWQRGQAVDEWRSDTFGVDAVERFEEEGVDTDEVLDAADRVVFGPDEEEFDTGVAPVGQGRARGVEVSTRALGAGAGLLGATAAAEGQRRDVTREEETVVIDQGAEIEVPEDGEIGQAEIEVDDRGLTDQVGEIGVPEQAEQFREIERPEAVDRTGELGVPTDEGSSLDVIDTQQLIGQQRQIEEQDPFDELEGGETTVIGEEDLVDPDELRQQEREELRQQVEEMAEYTESPSDRFEQAEDTFWSPETESDEIMDEATGESPAERALQETTPTTQQQPAQDIVPGSVGAEDQRPGERGVADATTDVGVDIDRLFDDIPAFGQTTTQSQTESDGALEQQALGTEAAFQTATGPQTGRRRFEFGLPDLPDSETDPLDGVGVDIEDERVVFDIEDPDFLDFGGQNNG